LHERLERGVVKLLLLAFEKLQLKHSTGEAIGEIARFAWFSDAEVMS
jgi:hypothetical protein